MSKAPDIFEKIVRRNQLRRAIRRFWRFSIRAIGIVILFVIFLWFLFQNTRFQNWLTQRAAHYLSDELQTKVEVDRLELDFFDKLVLKNVFIEDLSGDTLIYSEKIKVNLNTNLIQILRSNLDISDISLINTQFNLVRDSGQAANNLVMLLENISNKAKEDESQSGQKDPFLFDLDALYLNQVRFVQEDVGWGKYLNIYIDQGEITLNELNLQEKLIDIESAVILQPSVLVEERLRDEEAYNDEWNAWAEGSKNQAPPNEENPEEAPTFFKLKVDHFDLNEGKFVLHNYRKAPEKLTPDEIIDYNHLDVFDIHVDIDSFQFTQDVYRGEVKKISFRDLSGFVLDELSAREAIVQNRRVELNGMKLITPYSDMGDTLVLKYRSFYDFLDYNNKVLMDGKFKNSRVALRDLMVFAPPLDSNAFFIKNQDEAFLVDGQMRGRVNNLRGSNLNVRLGSGLAMKGSFSSRNLAVRNEEFLNLRLERLSTDMQTIKDLVPGFDPPPNFYNLGQLDFSGRFDGFFVDFVADGELVTDIGSATMDMRLDLKDGREGAKYSGGLNLHEFDLGGWSGNPDFGLITMSSQVKDGVGLTLESVNAKLGANIESLTIKGYNYENLTMEGQLNKSLFDGDLSIRDENIDFVFAGSIEMKDTIPFFDFGAKVNRLDLQALNLVEANYVLAADSIDLKINGNNISNVQGSALAKDIEITFNDTSFYQIDSLIAFSSIDTSGRKLFQLQSEIMQGSLDGYFDLQQVPQALIAYLEKNYTDFAEQFNIKSKGKDLVDHRFDFDIKIYDTKDLLELVDPKLDTLRGVVASGYFDNVQDSLNVDLEVPGFGYANVAFDDIVVLMNGNSEQSNLDLGINHTVLNGKTHFQPLWALCFIDRDTLNFGINATNFSTVLDNLNLNGKLYFQDEYLQVSFQPSDLVILSEKWDIDANNYIRFSKDRIETKNFELTNDDKIITLQSQGDKGLLFNLQNLDIEFVNNLWTYDKLKFKGDIGIRAQTVDVYKLKDLTANVLIDTFWVNGDDWGQLKIKADMADLKQPVWSYLTIGKEKRMLKADGFFVPSTETSRQSDSKYPPNYLNYKIDIADYPLNIAEYFIGHSVSNTIGKFDADLKLEGIPSKPSLTGTVDVYDGALTIDYLGVRYFVDQQRANVTENLFDASGAFITDRFNNRAYVTGGITHDHLKNWGLDVTVSSPRFEALNTTEDDNPLYYGTGIGSGTVHFSGTFQQTNIEIDAVTGRGSSLNIPIDYGQSTSKRSFITFINEQQPFNGIDPGLNTFRGINLDMKLQVTDVGEVQLIFDEKEGDIIRGRGNGNIQLIITRTGDMFMYGDYVIESGDYLFTLPELAVNKKFEVKSGGTIRWSGDPYDARIDLEAFYSGLRTSPYLFVKDFLELGDIDNSGLEAEARLTTPVDLTMDLEGALLQPNINFKIDFPALTGELKGLVENRMRLIGSDQNEINRQVFGLIVLGTFLPDGEDALGGNTAGLVFVNTLTEMLSNQLSLLITEIFSAYIREGGIISGVDFDVSADFYEASTAANLDNLNSWEFQIRPKLYLWDDRVSIDAGLVQGSYIGENYTAADVSFDVKLTEDGRWKFFFYNRPELDIQGRTNKTGAGIRYRREFDSFKELFSKKRRSKKRAERKEEEKQKEAEQLTTRKN